MATANPAMNAAVYQRAGRAFEASSVMTLQGTVLKTAFLLAVLAAAAGYTWSQAVAGSPLTYGLLMAGAIGGLVTAFLTIFMPKVSPFTAPLYAVLEGLVLGAISAAFEAAYHGIAIKAVGLSVGVLAMMLFVYGTGIIRVTEKFKIGVVAATGAICLVYLVDVVASFFGAHLPFIHQSGYFGIGFSLVVVVIAALNLVLDFDFIEKGVQLEAPKYMEWYGGFSLLVTLVWMYLEILRLLAKVQGGSRN
ncbi:MAG TPA: Bax inhibitor-1/YccA family protein [Planctomycetaceae bacterium]|nr:Bax inhibitor-1/YccA family protein [Planctomycetaceae bacterium]